LLEILSLIFFFVGHFVFSEQRSKAPKKIIWVIMHYFQSRYKQNLHNLNAKRLKWHFN